eukprot:TRINITY_DN7063_c0_g1_i1.p1 TRINITY_DN7063_c0_g1~~TRINITY_DN7063_c0_g1_i1.p1  ORF type:complete len:503 (-),score=136.68 TRINITY_DN7063_c0_g1_i1:516-1853(-)
MSGKSSLLLRLQGGDFESRSEMALDYSYIDVRKSTDTDEDPVSRINAWQLEGENSHRQLLRFALNATTIEHSLAVIALDLSQPWNAVTALKNWLDVLTKHVDSVSAQLPEGKYEALQRAVRFSYQTFQEPSDEAPRVVDRKPLPGDAEALRPIPEGALVRNLGIPIVVVGCKSDLLEHLEKEYGYKHDHFEFIQQYLRRICLAYGATLIYTSAKTMKNVDVLLHYIQFKLYGFEFGHRVELVEKDGIFMPAGADAPVRIQLDFDSQRLTKDAEEPFEEIITLPKNLHRTGSEIDPIVKAMDDQDFLARCKEIVDADAGKDGHKQGLLSSLIKLSSSSNVNQSPTASSSNLVAAQTGSAADLLGQLRSAQSAAALNPPSGAPAAAAAPAADGSKPAAAPSSGERQVLTDFFTSLINKGAHGGALSRTTSSAANVAGSRTNLQPKKP